ncbi:MAG: 30S ribosomal protein S12 methylthiotransferase RimO [Clostridiaceae bacterium]|nr:30S ribosomal protein S12 methylthiotransferase RimO [Clostridiaceae bacterium]
MKNNQFFILSLGCPKNEVDAESMSFSLRQHNYLFTDNPFDAKYLIVNTCGFIQSAKEEAIEAILDLAEIKQSRLDNDKLAYLIVTGCLSQRYAKQIYHEFPEVDLVLGTAQYDQIVNSIDELEQGKSLRGRLPKAPGSLKHLFQGEQASSDRYYAYLKIAEGCSNRCAFCAIPGIRGPLLSRPIEDILAEAKLLTERGFKEIILIAQDTTRYGADLYGEPKLLELLKQMVIIPNIGLIRLMYVYGDVFSDELIDFIAENKKIAPYIDIPIQHASDKILKSMLRRDTNASLRQLISKLREKIPHVVLRTTILVGFPGETDADFSELVEFVRDIKFDRLGCFIFSPEEGTKAYRMSDIPDEETSLKRYNEIMQIQQEISLEKNRQRLNKIYDVLIEDISEDGLFYLARSYGEAPGVDPSVHVLARHDNIELGDVVQVEIIDYDEYDLTGVSVDESS